MTGATGEIRNIDPTGACSDHVTNGAEYQRLSPLAARRPFGRRCRSESRADHKQPSAKITSDL